ncbi:MAG: phosphatidylcholine/phosphatidylserine synthase [Vicinamibacterales bacterium]
MAWIAHLYTALGAGTALAATLATFAGDIRAAFLWLTLAVFIDSTDGVLARALRVKERLPWFSGETLDNVVDYLTYVFVPVVIILRAGLLPPPLAPWLATAVLVASGYGFSRDDAKVATTDHYFTGFPSYWNIVALYLFAWRLPPWLNATVLAGLVVLVFVPLRYVYPSRTRAWRPATLLLGTTWAVFTAVVVWRLPAVDGPWLPLSLIFPVYYAALSVWLTMRERAAAP